MNDQRLAALASANRVHSARAQLRREVRTGDLSLSEAIEEDCAQGMELYKLLLCIRGIGPSKLRKIDRSVPVYRAVGDLSSEHRRLLRGMFL
jgi:hypothetical protein